MQKSAIYSLDYRSKHFLGRYRCIDIDKETLLLVVADERLCGGLVDLKAVPDGLWLVIVALDQRLARLTMW